MKANKIIAATAVSIQFGLLLYFGSDLRDTIGSRLRDLNWLASLMGLPMVLFPRFVQNLRGGWFVVRPEVPLETIIVSGWLLILVSIVATLFVLF